jgi:hypothetical protein
MSMDLREVEIKRIEKISELVLKAARAVPDRETDLEAPAHGQIRPRDSRSSGDGQLVLRGAAARGSARADERARNVRRSPQAL